MFMSMGPAIKGNPKTHRSMYVYDLRVRFFCFICLLTLEVQEGISITYFKCTVAAHTIKSQWLMHILSLLRFQENCWKQKIKCLKRLYGILTHTLPNMGLLGLCHSKLLPIRKKGVKCIRLSHQKKFWWLTIKKS